MASYIGAEKMSDYDCIIIGGGAAGLFAAANLPPEWKSLLLEKNANCGSKLLLTGNGQCNLTHYGHIQDFFSHYNSSATNFLKGALYNFTNLDLLDYFRQRGVDFIQDENGKFFPRLLQASEILEILLKECRKKTNLQIQCSQSVVELVKESSGIIVKTPFRSYQTRRLLLAGGGSSYPHTGSNGDGCRLAAQLGHTITPLRPALSPLKIKNYPFTDCPGLTFPEMSVTLYRQDQFIHRQTGSVLLTHHGLSGPAILNLSRFAQIHDNLRVDFLNGVKLELFIQNLQSFATYRGKTHFKTFLHEHFLLPQRWLDTLNQSLSSPLQSILSISINQLSKSHRIEAYNYLSAYPMKIQSVGGFEQAMVTAGGVDLKEVNSKTMESRIIPGLYIAGEVLDIDGDTGGYNLQAAFSTALLAICEMIKFLNCS